MIYVVFPVHNRVASTQKFLESISLQTYSDFKVVICDDGSTDGTWDYVSTNHPDVVLLRGDGNLWWTAGINRCIQYVLNYAADADYVLTINNDVTLPSNYLEQKAIRAREHPNAIIGSLCVYMHDHDLIETSGFRVDFNRLTSTSLTKRGERRSKQHTGIREATSVPGKGVLVPASVYRDIGLYDDKDLPQYHADTDFILRAHKAGYKILVDFDSVVFSDINLNNMTIPGQEITLRTILKTFRGPYSPNNFKVNAAFAKKHFPDRYHLFLFKKYVRIIGGMIRRYGAFQLVRIRRTLKGAP